MKSPAAAGNTITVTSTGSLVNEITPSPTAGVQPTPPKQTAATPAKISRQIVQTPHGPQLIQTINTAQQQPTPPAKPLTAAATQLLTAKLTAGGTPVKLPVAGQPPANGDNQQAAIESIVQSLMSAGERFEQKKHDEIMLKSPVAAGTSGQQQPSPLAGQQVVVTGGGGNAAQLLPTVPVPAASLVGQRLPSGRVTLQNLRSIPGGGGGQQVVTPVKVRTIVVNMYVLYRPKGHV